MGSDPHSGQERPRRKGWRTKWGSDPSALTFSPERGGNTRKNVVRRKTLQSDASHHAPPPSTAALQWGVRARFRRAAPRSVQTTVLNRDLTPITALPARQRSKQPHFTSFEPSSFTLVSLKPPLQMDYWRDTSNVPDGPEGAEHPAEPAAAESPFNVVPVIWFPEDAKVPVKVLLT